MSENIGATMVCISIGAKLSSILFSLLQLICKVDLKMPTPEKPTQKLQQFSEALLAILATFRMSVHKSSTYNL